MIIVSTETPNSVERSGRDPQSEVFRYSVGDVENLDAGMGLKVGEGPGKKDGSRTGTQPCRNLVALIAVS